LIRIDLDTGAETELRTLDRAGGGTVLGRDGQKVTVNLSDSGPTQVVTVGLRGGDATPLTNDLARYGGVSAAGDAIVTTRYQTASSLWVVDDAGRNARQIGRDVSAGVGDLCWAGNERLLSSAAMAGGAGIWSADSRSGSSDLLVPDAGSPSMSADGRTLVFFRRGGLFRADADGRNPARIADRYSARISPDGSRVFYLSS